MTQSSQGRRTGLAAAGAGESGAESRPYQQEGGLVVDQIVALVTALAVGTVSPPLRLPIARRSCPVEPHRSLRILG